MCRKLSILSLIATTGGMSLLGQTQDTLHLSEEGAIKLGIERNLNLEASRLGIHQARTDRRVSLAKLFPEIGLSGQYGYTLKKQVVYFGGGGGSGTGTNPFASLMPADGIEMGQTHNITGGITAAMPLVNFQLWESLKLDQISVEQALEKVRSSEVNLRNEIRKAYIGILFAQDNVDVLELSLSTMEANLKDIALKFEKGLVAEYDYVRMQTQVSNLRPSLLQAEQQVRLAKMKLLILMNYDPELPLAVTGSLSRDYQSAIANIMMEQNLQPNLQDNSTLRSLDLTRKQLETGIRVKRMEYMPSLALSFNYTYNFASDELHLSNSRRWSPNSVIGLRLSIPLFSGGSTYYGLKSLQLQRRQLELQTSDAERQLDLQATNLRQQKRQATEMYQSSLTAEGSAQKGLSIARVRYQSGNGTLLELNDAELALRQAQLSRNQAIYNAMVATYEYEALQGK